MINILKVLILLLLMKDVITNDIKNDMLSREEEFQSIEREYRLTNSSKGKYAIKEAIEFVMQQKDQINELQERKKYKNDSNDIYEPNSSCDSNHLKGLCPYCNLTIDSIIDDGRFVYLNDMSNPPYSHRCWSLRVRYHTAPECENEELKRNLPPIWKWKWGTKDSLYNRCLLPPSFPPIALERYAKLNNIKKEASKPFVVFMMGLSFMGQPFQSLGCLYDKYVVGGQSFHPKPINVTAIRENGGQCTGYKQPEILNYYPTDLHPGVVLPSQNVEFCSMDQSLIKFRYKNHREVHVCYTYIFNVRKNFPKGSKLPCDLTWNDIDIGISILPKSELFQYVVNTGGDVQKLSHLKLLIITTIYEGVIEGQLKAAYLKNGFSELKRPDYRAKYNNCSETVSDVHYRMPGVPDYAVRVWFSLIATGLLEDYKMHGSIKYYGGKICKSKGKPVMEYEC